jgi:aspartokinase-like uncharacterized kinase
MTGFLVVKVGGSLYNLADLGPRLRAWLAKQNATRMLLVPGGGPTADVIRAFDARHRLGEEAAHWLALRALTLNAHFLAHLLPGTTIIDDPARCPRLALLDVHAFACADEGRLGCLPHDWRVTSDALAARVAVTTRADGLVLLKSRTLPSDLSWEEAGRQGFVDEMFAAVAARLRVQVVNLRAEE